MGFGAGTQDDELVSGDPLDGIVEDQKVKYIGVPDDYTVPDPFGANIGPGVRRGARALGVGVPPAERTPFFREGADLVPAAFSPAIVAQIQEDLATAGLLKKYRKGVWDESTRKGYRGLLSYANRAGISDAEEALRRWITTGQQMGGEVGGETRRPFSAQVTNPMDLQAAAEPQAQEEIGRRLTPQEMQGVAGEYQGMEVGAQRSEYNAAEAGGTVTQAPNFSSYLQSKLHQIDPKGAQKMDTIGLAEEFFSMFGGE